MKMTNPDRASRGGDVAGSSKIDMYGAVAGAIDVAEASFDPGYDIDESLQYASKADMKKGFCTYGVGVGASRGKGYL